MAYSYLRHIALVNLYNLFKSGSILIVRWSCMRKGGWICILERTCHVRNGKPLIPSLLSSAVSLFCTLSWIYASWHLITLSLNILVLRISFCGNVTPALNGTTGVERRELVFLGHKKVLVRIWMSQWENALLFIQQTKKRKC